MNSKRRGFLWGMIIVVVIILTLFYTTLHTYNKNVELKEINTELNANILNQTQTINDLQTENETLNQNIIQLVQDKTSIEQEKNLIQNEKDSLQNEKNNLESENQSLKEQLKEAQANKQNPTTVIPTNQDFKSYMGYDKITDKTSRQWALQQSAITDENGIRRFNGLPMVAVGTGWGLSVGDTALVTCDNGNSFKVVVGDIKADIHTYADNKTTIGNCCRCEFIVDEGKLNGWVKQLGNVAGLEQYKGYVVNITKV